MASENDQVLVRAKRPFEGDEGYKDERSEPFKVTRRRASDLMANDLVEQCDARPAVKQAPEPANKMATAPANKVRPDAAPARKV